MAQEYKSVKLKMEIYKLVEKNKVITGVPIGVFISQAILEKLKTDSKKPINHE